MDFQLSDKVAHVLAYMVLMLWFTNLYSQRFRQFQIGVAFVMMGVCLELLQGTSEYRTFAYTDMLANGFGILLAWYLTKTPLGTCLLHLDTWLVRSN